MITWIFGKYLFIHNLDGSFALEQVNDSAGESNEHEELSEAKKIFTNSHIQKQPLEVFHKKGVLY